MTQVTHDAQRRKLYVYAITGITGKVGGNVACTLLAAGLPVRADVRDAGKGRPWVEKKL